MKDIYNDVETELKLQPFTEESFLRSVTNMDPDARPDIRVRGSWTNGRNTFFDTWVFYPHA